MSTYQPNNISVFIAACAGCLSGIQGQSSLTGSNSSAYSATAVVATTFAQEFDTQWGVTAPDEFQCKAIGNLSTAYWLRSVVPASLDAENPDTYSETVRQFILVIQAATVVLTSLDVVPPPYPPPPLFDVRDFGASGDGSDETVQIKSAIAALNAAGGGTLVFPQTLEFFAVSDELAISSDTTVQVDGILRQTVHGKNLLTAVDKSHIEVSGIGQLQGVGGLVFKANEHAVYFKDCDFVNIGDNLDINTLAGHGVFLIGCSNCSVGSSTVRNIAGGVRLQGCSGVVLSGTSLLDTSRDLSTFGGGFFLDSTDGNTYPPNSDILFVGCRAKTQGASQNFECHAGVRISWIGCDAEDAVIGFSCNPFSPGADGYGIVSTSFTQPPVNSVVTVPFTMGPGPTIGQYVIVSGGGYYRATSVAGGNVTLLNMGDEYNAPPGDLVAADGIILPGDLTRDINITGISYEGTDNDTGFIVQHGIVIGGDPNNPVRNVAIAGGTIDRGGLNGTDIPGAGLYTNNCVGVTLNGTTFDYCYGSAIYLDIRTQDFVAQGFHISNMQELLGVSCGVAVAAAGVTGRCTNFTVNGANFAVQFVGLDPLSPGFSADGFTNENCARVGVPKYGVVDGILYKPDGQTVVSVSPFVRTVLCNDSAPTTVTNPMSGAIDGQEIVYIDLTVVGNTTIDRENAYLAGGVNWTGVVVMGAEPGTAMIGLKFIGAIGNANEMWRVNGNS